MADKAKLPSPKVLLEEDLDYIYDNLREEFALIAGKRLLITGGAGFIGYHLVHTTLHDNRSATPDSIVDVTFYDNYVRGVPAWLTAIAE